MRDKTPNDYANEAHKAWLKAGLDQAIELYQSAKNEQQKLVAKRSWNVWQEEYDKY